MAEIDTEFIELLGKDIDKVIKDTRHLAKVSCSQCKMPYIILKNSIEYLRAKRDKEWHCPKCCPPNSAEAEPTDKELAQLEKFKE